MDPNEARDNLRDALQRRDDVAALDAAVALGGWIARGGFIPDGVTTTMIEFCAAAWRDFERAA